MYQLMPTLDPVAVRDPGGAQRGWAAGDHQASW
jgi:hypothetical protein